MSLHYCTNQSVSRYDFGSQRARQKSVFHFCTQLKCISIFQCGGGADFAIPKIQFPCEFQLHKNPRSRSVNARHFYRGILCIKQAKMKIINPLTNLNWQSRGAACHQRSQRGARSTFSFNDSDLSGSRLPNSTFFAAAPARARALHHHIVHEPPSMG